MADILQILKSTFFEFISTTDYAMSYNQVRFFIFLLVFLTVYFLLMHKTLKKVWILVGNIFFCIFSGWAGLVVVFGTAVIVYIISLLIELVYKKAEKDKEGLELSPKEKVAFMAKYKKRAKWLLWFALIFILGIWIYVKVCKFKGLPSVVSFEQWTSGMGIIVPLGISYYTLSAVGYLADNYCRKAKAVHNFLDLLVAMTYFHILFRDL